MKYYKNSDIANKYGVSSATPRNWINSTLAKKTNLDIIWVNHKAHILKSIHNEKTMMSLFENGRSKRPKISYKEVKPTETFYTTFSLEQKSEIIHQLEKNKMIPNKFFYFKGIDDILNKDPKSKIDPNDHRYNIEKIINLNYYYYLSLISKNTKINVVNIGGRDTSLIKMFLGRLIDKNLLNRYIAVDVSEDILNASKKDLHSWFGQSFPFVGYVKDLDNDKISDILLLNSKVNTKNTSKIINLVFFVNKYSQLETEQNKVLTNLSESLRSEDYVVVTYALTSDNTFKVISRYKYSDLSNLNIDQQQWLIDSLGIPKDSYTVNKDYDHDNNYMYIYLEFNIDISIVFQEPKKYSRTINFSKGDQLIISRYCYRSFLDLIKKFGTFNLKANQFICSPDSIQSVFTLSLDTRLN